MIGALRAIGSAFAYFTILPIRGSRDDGAQAPDAYAISFLPLIGAVVGAAAGLFGWFTAWRMPGFGGVAAWIATIALTGAIHVDGFLDCCDGVLVTASPQRRLEILRDPRHGTFAIVGMAMISILWVKALDVLPPPQLPIALAFTGIVARLAAVVNAWIFPYARIGSATRAFATRPNAWIVAAGAIVACALGWWLGPATIALIPLALGAGIVLAFFASRRLGGGITGDVYGAIVTIVEVLLVLRLPEIERLIAPR